ncbi:MAG: hypothetical protein ACRBCL_07760 [Maritimibacter sp.]
MTFRHTCMLTTLLALVLAAGLILVPGLFLWLFGLEGDVAATVMARHAGVLFLGLSIILFGARRARGRSQFTIALGLSVMMGAMALLGLIELSLGRVGAGIIVAILTEGFVAFGFARFLRA